MSIQISVQAPAIVHSAGVDDTRGPSAVARARNEAGDQGEASALACRDVVDEVRLRMARRGFQWE